MFNKLIMMIAVSAPLCSASIEEDAQRMIKVMKASKEDKSLRRAHAKSHGIYAAELKVNSDLKKDFRVGIFSRPGRKYSALARYSNSKSKIVKDSEGDARALAFKVLNVDHAPIVADEHYGKSQDFIMLTSPVFVVKNSTQFAGLLENLAKNGSPMGYFFPSYWPCSWNLKQLWIGRKLSSQKPASLIDQTYHSVTPYSFGGKAVKYSLIPCSSKKYSYPKNPSNDFLRLQLENELMQGRKVCYSFAVQFNEGQAPLEDATVKWKGTFHEIATLNIEGPLSQVQQDKVEKQSFQPWHASKDHRPLGSINAARRIVYQEMSKFRK